MSIHGKKKDDYLTPPDLIKALGKFDLDPCTPIDMPWKTAKKMYNINDNGLIQKWGGRIFMNPPYSNLRNDPWIDKFIANGKGIALVSAKSVDTVWCQKLLKASHSIVLLSGRIKFYYTDGTQSEGAFLSNMLVSLTSQDTYYLNKLINETKYKGVIFKNEGDDL